MGRCPGQPLGTWALSEAQYSVAQPEHEGVPCGLSVLRLQHKFPVLWHPIYTIFRVIFSPRAFVLDPCLIHKISF